MAASAAWWAAGGRSWAWAAHAYGAGPQLHSARRPALRAPDHVLVRVRAASLNPLDCAMLEGYGSRVLNALRSVEAEGWARAEGVEFPLVVGRDFVGRVVRAGPAARLRPGARVWGVVPPHRPGAHAQHVLVRDAWAAPAPAALDEVQAGGALYAALSACAVLRAAGLPPGAGRAPGAGGPRALLLGLGGVGHAALQLMVADGVQVVVGCAGEQCERALSLGAVAAYDRHEPTYRRRLADGGPYAAVVDCAGVGGPAGGVGAALGGPAGGMGAAVGGPAGGVGAAVAYGVWATLTSPLLRDTDAHGLAAGLATAAGRWAGGWAATGRCAPPERWAYFAPRTNDIEHVARLAQRGQFSVQVERVYPWWEADAAYERAAGGHARGKIVLDWDSNLPPPDAPPPARTHRHQHTTTTTGTAPDSSGSTTTTMK